ncbi:TraY domain-containing protein [Nocardiopsis sp. HUAS JQ3]|jgi:RHH-type rel operon transcriptional repressor/antitoxin RelB|uniref:type II toxin-antitoxin system RelB family antitoxin n=1 Tax=Nocardiopsis sp. HUAS JQ3 TaxID=3061629 RepID=UPI0023A965D0|nr:TraY domain-containing protein [Nocardiopsis sp. HUAS JQ3]WDZ92423.1 TraY domain-containing protein [Nocardiopsis sp. HUAS JQ3]
MLALRLPAEIEDRLEALAKETGRSKSFYAREAIVAHLDELEEVYLAERRLEDLRAGRSGTTPLSEVMDEHDVES